MKERVAMVPLAWSSHGEKGVRGKEVEGYLSAKVCLNGIRSSCCNANQLATDCQVRTYARERQLINCPLGGSFLNRSSCRSHCSLQPPRGTPGRLVAARDPVVTSTKIFAQLLTSNLQRLSLRKDEDHTGPSVFTWVSPGVHRRTLNGHIPLSHQRNRIIIEYHFDGAMLHVWSIPQVAPRQDRA